MTEVPTMQYHTYLATVLRITTSKPFSKEKSECIKLVIPR